MLTTELEKKLPSDTAAAFATAPISYEDLTRLLFAATKAALRKRTDYDALAATWPQHFPPAQEMSFREKRPPFDVNKLTRQLEHMFDELGNQFKLPPSMHDYTYGAPKRDELRDIAALWIAQDGQYYELHRQWPSYFLQNGDAAYRIDKPALDCEKVAAKLSEGIAREMANKYGFTVPVRDWSNGRNVGIQHALTGISWGELYLQLAKQPLVGPIAAQAIADLQIYDPAQQTVREQGIYGLLTYQWGQLSDRLQGLERDPTFSKPEGLTLRETPEWRIWRELKREYMPKIEQLKADMAALREQHAHRGLASMFGMPADAKRTLASMAQQVALMEGEIAQADSNVGAQYSSDMHQRRTEHLLVPNPDYDPEFDSLTDSHEQREPTVYDPSQKFIYEGVRPDIDGDAGWRKWKGVERVDDLQLRGIRQVHIKGKRTENMQAKQNRFVRQTIDILPVMSLVHAQQRMPYDQSAVERGEGVLGLEERAFVASRIIAGHAVIEKIPSAARTNMKQLADATDTLAVGLNAIVDLEPSLPQAELSKGEERDDNPMRGADLIAQIREASQDILNAPRQGWKR